MQNNRNVLLGVTGSVAAYKAADLARRLTDDGISVTTVLTRAACRFITPLTFQSICGNPAYVDLFDDPYIHLNLSRDAHVMVVAPATANTINKFSSGIADDLLGNLWLSREGPTMIAPAMNFRMYNHPVVQESIKNLKSLGVTFIGPERGRLACGEEGMGRMAEVSTIVEAIASALSPRDFEGERVLITAGPTYEPIDAVRFIGNRSSGKMGYALARAAARRGARVTLISGPSSEAPPPSVTTVFVESAQEMHEAVLKRLPQAKTLIMAAAVSDFAPRSRVKAKLEKKAVKTLSLKQTRDIAQEVGQKKGRRIVVGFAAERGRNIERARKKLADKNLDMIVFNDVSVEGAGFQSDTNIVTIIGRDGEETDYPMMKKSDVADIILDNIRRLKDRKK